MCLLDVTHSRHSYPLPTPTHNQRKYTHTFYQGDDVKRDVVALGVHDVGDFPRKLTQTRAPARGRGGVVLVVSVCLISVYAQ